MPTRSRRRETLPTGTKYRILELLARDELTADALSQELRLSATAVRQHLANLDALGLVERRKTTPGPGRPAYLYRLSDAAQAALPKRYDLLLKLLVEVLEARQGEGGVAELFAEAGGRLAREIAPRFEALPSKRRRSAILEWLEAEFGWQADAEDTAPQLCRITVHQCPFRAVTVPHPALCGAFFTTLLEALGLGSPVTHSPLEGVACCALELRSGPKGD